MLETSVSFLALIVSVFTFWFTHRRARSSDQMLSYLAVEREGDNQIFLPLLQYDFLNSLYYENPPETPPDSDLPLEKLTAEQRALLNYGTIVLDYFEQMVLLEKSDSIPKGISKTWEPWIKDCAHAPYFRWVWRINSEHYHPELRKIVDGNIKSSGRRDVGSEKVA